MRDGSITFSTALDNAQLEKDLDRLGKKILRERELLGGLKIKKNGLEKQLKAAGAALDELQKKTKAAHGGAVISFGDVEKIALLKPAVSAIKGEIGKYTEAIRESNRELESAKSSWGEVYAQLEDIRRQAQAGDGGTLKDRAGEFHGRVREASSNLLQPARQLFEKLFRDGFGGFAKAGRDAAPADQGAPGGPKTGSAEKKKKNGFAPAAKQVLSLAKRLKVVLTLSKAIGGAFKRLGGTIKEALVSPAVHKGLSMLREQAAAYLRANTQFSGTLQQLKGILLTAFQPVYDAAVPALMALLNVLSRAAAAAAQFMAGLFGVTAKRAQENAKALYGQAMATEAAGSAAEEAAGSLAGFDEINTIQTEKQGGGGTAGDTGSLFDYAYEDMPFSSWGEAFSALLDRMLSGIPNLMEAFKGFSDWLNGLTKKLYDMFAFPGALEKAGQLGRDLAGALNQLIDSVDWYQLGQAAGAGLNLALQLLTELIYTFDWIGLGARLAECVNGIVSETDWGEFGRLLWAKLKIALETLGGFIAELDMPQLAGAVSDMITGFFNSVTETIQNIDWFKLGEQIRDFLVNIKWAEIAESVAAAAGQAVRAFFEFVQGFLGEAWGSLVSWWNDTAFEDGKFTIGGLLNGIWEAVKDIGAWIKEHIFDPFVNGFKDVFGIDPASTVMEEMGGGVMDGLFNGINDAIAPIVELFEGIFNGFTSFVEDVFTVDWKAAWEGAANIFKGIWNGIVSTLESAVNLIIRGINFLIGKVNGLIGDGLLSKGLELFGLPNGKIPTISQVQIPRLAQGAVIPPNREFMAVLGDQRSGMNLEAPEGLMRRIVREEAGGGESAALLQAILTAVKAGHVIMVDGSVFGRTAIKTINSVTTSAGRQLLLL